MIKEVTTTTYYDDETEISYMFLPYDNDVTLSQTDEGYTVTYVTRDEHPINPRECMDNLGTMICFGKYSYIGDEHTFKEPDEFLCSLADSAGMIDAKDTDGKEWDQIIMKILAAHYVLVPIYCYDHGGITISTTPYECQWDSGQIGFIYVSKHNLAGSVKQPEAILKAEIATLDQYLTGDVYCAVRETFDNDKRHMDYSVCCGYYGVKEAKQASLEEF